jgi:long-subunit fatty acid transport protein
MHEALNINGSTSIASPGQTTQTSSGGLFTADSNIGHHSRDEFTAIWELGLNLNYRFRPCTQLNIGYTLIFINDVLLPANNIDTNIGASTATTGAPTHPIALFNHSQFVIQGLNLGISQDF